MAKTAIVQIPPAKDRMGRAVFIVATPVNPMPFYIALAFLYMLYIRG